MISREGASFPAPQESRPDPRWILSTGACQWQGTRNMQNDALFVSDSDPQRGLLIALADGIGTDRQAGKAARIAAEAMREDYLTREPMKEIHRQTLRMIGAAHRAVRGLNEAAEAAGGLPTGVTAACVLIRNRRMSFSSAGNVRVFLFRMGMLLQLNREHLLSLEAEERDILRGEAPDLDPGWAKQVTSFIGMDGLQKVDCQSTPVLLIPGDRILVMSSGLYGVLSEEELIRQIGAGPPQQAAEAVIRQVQQMHPASQSNISIAVVRIGG